MAVLIGVAGGVVPGGAAAGRRTESACARFVAAHGFDAVAHATGRVPTWPILPGVASATEPIIAGTGGPLHVCPSDERERLQRLRSQERRIIRPDATSLLGGRD
jgi:hypothetical protein